MSLFFVDPFSGLSLDCTPDSAPFSSPLWILVAALAPAAGTLWGFSFSLVVRREGAPEGDLLDTVPGLRTVAVTLGGYTLQVTMGLLVCGASVTNPHNGRSAGDNPRFELKKVVSVAGAPAFLTTAFTALVGFLPPLLVRLDTWQALATASGSIRGVVCTSCSSVWGLVRTMFYPHGVKLIPWWVAELGNEVMIATLISGIAVFDPLVGQVRFPLLRFTLSSVQVLQRMLANNGIQASIVGVRRGGGRVRYSLVVYASDRDSFARLQEIARRHVVPGLRYRVGL